MTSGLIPFLSPHVANGHCAKVDFNECVFGFGDQLQMVGVDTFFPGAEMVKMEAFGNDAVVSLKDNPVRKKHAILDSDYAVPLVRSSALPNPTTSLGVNDIFDTGLSTVMVLPIRHRATFNPTATWARVRRKIGIFTATALAQSRTIGFFSNRAFRSVMAVDIPVRLACSVVVRNVLSAPASAKWLHVPPLSISGIIPW